jgi:DNA-binding IclR family transcriptional regulator
MGKHTPLFATAKTAASLLEMKEAEFLSLVKDGALPPAGKFDRWDVEHLQKAMRGDLIEGLENVEW